jgi:hypothetical protein
MFERILCEYEVFVVVVMETDDPSTIRFLQGIACATFVMTDEMCHVGSRPMGIVHVLGLHPRSSSLEMGLVFL